MVEALVWLSPLTLTAQEMQCVQITTIVDQKCFYRAEQWSFIDIVIVDQFETCQFYQCG